MSNIKTWQERPEKTYRGNFFTQVSDEERRDAEVKELRELLEELEADLADARKDQARYQWLRNKANSTKEAAPLVFFTDDTCKPTWQNVLHSADLDCAIDAAIKEQGK